MSNDESSELGSERDLRTLIDIEMRRRALRQRQLEIEIRAEVDPLGFALVGAGEVAEIQRGLDELDDYETERAKALPTLELASRFRVIAKATRTPW